MRHKALALVLVLASAAAVGAWLLRRPAPPAPDCGGPAPAPKENLLAPASDGCGPGALLPQAR